MATEEYRSNYGLENHGFRNLEREFWNLSTPALYEQAVRFREGLIAHLGPLVVRTGDHTGRSPNDKFIVREPSSEDKIWWGPINRECSEANWEMMYHRMMAYFENRSAFVQDCFAGTDARYRIPIRIVTETAWHSLFARNMFVRIMEPDHLRTHVPEFVVIDAPNLHAPQSFSCSTSGAFILVNFAAKMILIGGTRYAGEIKKSIFSIMNYLLPQRGVMAMHCSANYGESRDDAALFFGLSGTGKTTLSNDTTRTLVGDDEHGWSDDGIFNFEGGCYAKVINLSPEGEPEIWNATRRFGTILENVAIDSTRRRIDLDDASFTENTRAAYPITHIPNADYNGVAGHPRNIVFLTADAFGVMPPIARLTPAQAQYHFLAGYTAKVAGTEAGVTEPKATFSTCFGAPFMPLHPTIYAELLAENVQKHGAQLWLINTGWTGGPHGVGSRMKLSYTRTMVRAALNGDLDNVATTTDPIFGFELPTEVPGVPSEILQPRNTWSDPAAYDAQAAKLVQLFHDYMKQFEGELTDEVKACAPVAPQPA
ncbi:MAG: phosphoenolpyruvate carboxykinase (ATP) [Chloroflexi bacterium]|nr:phosphoenolpyruvate carboxykinase (ATP) [Chloroflexota bacterium]